MRVQGASTFRRPFMEGEVEGVVEIAVARRVFEVIEVIEKDVQHRFHR